MNVELLDRINLKKFIKDNGTIEWRINSESGPLHNPFGPAVECANGYKGYFLNDQPHNVCGPAILYPDGSREYCVDGKLHREDGPAVIRANGTREWYINGELHREDGPAVERSEKDVEYYRYGKLHNDKGPAVIYPDGTQKYCKFGKLHREDGPAIISGEGTKKYYFNSLLHREDGPAIERKDGRKEYYMNNRLHNEKGPAVVTGWGDQEYFIDGERLTQEEFMKRTKKQGSSENINSPVEKQGQKNIHQKYPKENPLPKKQKEVITPDQTHQRRDRFTADNSRLNEAVQDKLSSTYSKIQNYVAKGSKAISQFSLTSLYP